MIPSLVLKTENKVIYNKSNLNCKTFFEEFTCTNLFTSFVIIHSIQIMILIEINS